MFLSSTNVETSYGAHSASYLISTGLFPGVNGPKSEVNLSLPSSVEINNVCYHTSKPLAYFYGVDRDSRTITNAVYLSFSHY